MAFLRARLRGQYFLTSTTWHLGWNELSAESSLTLSLGELFIHWRVSQPPTGNPVSQRSGLAGTSWNSMEANNIFQQGQNSPVQWHRQAQTGLGAALQKGLGVAQQGGWEKWLFLSSQHLWCCTWSIMTSFYIPGTKKIMTNWRQPSKWPLGVLLLNHAN